jgi:hypothetical protein
MVDDITYPEHKLIFLTEKLICIKIMYESIYELFKKGAVTHRVQFFTRFNTQRWGILQNTDYK